MVNVSTDTYKLFVHPKIKLKKRRSNNNNSKGQWLNFSLFATKPFYYPSHCEVNLIGSEKMGNLKYESNAEKIIENFKNMTVIAQKEGISFVNDSMNKVVSLAKPLTPVKSGNLRRGYRVVKARKLSSGRIVGEVINNEHYFKYVEEGHRTKNGGFVKGKFMLTRATNLANMSYIPRRFKQMAIKIVKKGK